jgi:enoyl-CoA hydratase / 3-hydroxyacyl-CoA dehydrogenase
MEQATAKAAAKAAAQQTGSVVDRFSLKAFAEACRVLEEGIASLKDIEVGMMMGAGILPGPFSRADERGLDEMLEALEGAEREWGEGFAPPTVLRRLVAQGRLGRKSGQGFFPYPQPDPGFEQKETVLLETRGEVALIWLNRPPANPLSPQLIKEFGELWKHCHESSEVRSVVIASSNIFTFSAGADIKEFTKMDASGGAGLLDSGHAMLREMETSSTTTVAAVNSIAFGGGCELSMACDFRLAAESATFGQPEINLGIIPGFGGTQRLPRLVGEGKALEMNLTGEAISAVEAYRLGLAHVVVPDHELLDTAINWARKLAGQAPVAIEQIKTASAKGDLDDGIAAEKQGFAKAFTSEDAREGITAFIQKRKARFQGK